MTTDKLEIMQELERGGEWLGDARRWIQNNVKDGDRMVWSEPTIINMPFNKLQQFALHVAIAAVAEDRRKQNTKHQKLG